MAGNDPGAGGLRDLDDAVRALGTRLQPIRDRESVGLREARGRHAALDVHAAAPVPAFANSAMDGYALDSAAFAAGNPRLRVTGHSRAGHPAPAAPGDGACVRIATGAPLPPGTDAVVMQEDVRRVDDTYVEVLAPPQRGQWVRLPGHDFSAGTLLVAAGTRLEPRHVGLLAAAGVARIDVVRRPRVVVLSTGDELRDPGTALQPGQVHDANRFMLLAQLEAAGAEAIDGGRVADDAARVRGALAAACDLDVDLVLTSGGVSVGDPDFVGRVLSADAEVEFWKLAVKPGKPLLFARHRQRWVIGLPGNPVSTFVTFVTVVRPALARLCGAAWQPPSPVRARLSHPIHRQPGRLEFQRGILARDAAGDAHVAATGNQSSGMLSSVCAADCFIRIPRAAGDLAAGTVVDVLPFHGSLD
jgi:molybdopterin molybdotransferase